MLKDLIRLADKFDNAGMRKEADEVDQMIKRLAAPPAAAAAPADDDKKNQGGDLDWEQKASAIRNAYSLIAGYAREGANNVPKAKDKNVPPSLGAIKNIAYALGLIVSIVSAEYPDEKTERILDQLGIAYKTIRREPIQ